MLWFRFYYEYWKRYNSTLALEWGMSSFEDEEVERPEFNGEEITSPVDGSKTRYFSPQQRFRRIMGSLVRPFVLDVLFYIFAWPHTDRATLSDYISSSWAF